MDCATAGGKEGAAMSAKANGKASLIWLSLSSIHPARENELIYRPVSPDDPEIESLADSIAEHGLREPIVIAGRDCQQVRHRAQELVPDRLAGISPRPWGRHQRHDHRECRL
jgi:hypothetical protein